jgi:hypothetical protein
MIVAGVFALSAAAPGLAYADPAKDIQVAGRALTFLENGPTGPTVIGVVFDPSKPGSVAEKNAIMAAIGGGYSAGAITLTGKPMEAGDISGVKVVFVTHGVNYGAVSSQSKAKHIIAIGSDPACVQSGACVMGVSTDPSVQIVVNHNAAAAVGASFKAAFRMMIHEI